jgi:hypothetical protein
VAPTSWCDAREMGDRGLALPWERAVPWYARYEPEEKL